MVTRGAVRVAVPTLNDHLPDFSRLFELHALTLSDCTDVRFDFSACRFLRQNAVAFLGGLARLIQSRHGTVTFEWDTLQPDIRKALGKNGFLEAFGQSGLPWTDNAIPYRHDGALDKEGITGYLDAMWLGRGWVRVSRALQNAIVGRVWEIYENAFEHSRSPVGVFTCGQHYPRMGVLKLSVVDFGVGVPHNVRAFRREPGMLAASALEWAFRPGTTTSRTGIGRGLGLSLLKEFVQVNRGKLEVFSHSGYACVEQGTESYCDWDSQFGGTLLNLTLMCDERYYRFASEGAKGPLF